MGDIRITVQDGEIKIDLDSLLNELNNEQRDNISKWVCFEPRQIEAVCKRVVTDNVDWDGDADHWFGGWSTGEVSSLIEKARLALVPLMDDVSRAFITKLIEERAHWHSQCEQWTRLCWKIQQAWDSKDRPWTRDDIDYKRWKPSADDVAKAIREYEKMFAKGATDAD